MDSSTPESSLTGTKRKHSPSAEEPRSSAPAVTPIKYFVAPKGERLKVIQGDAETFSDVLAQLDAYEGMFLFHIASS